ncbi:arylsulfatase B-like [Hetaerina americana]|uniref:arylsulfatase B-like n=1 Tax=Hetaerina americana TaxID=62018 RepID=UPI003A7F42AE
MKAWWALLQIVMTCAFIKGSLAQSSKQPPNIIFIIADDLGWNDVGFHGSVEIPTPNIDALAYRGIILNNYYVAPLCTPSRSALMTGKYPIHTGMQHFVLLNWEARGLPLSERILPEYLKTLGYSTHAVGKWHLGFYLKEYTPEYRGFDSHVGHWTGQQDYYDHSATEEELWGLDMHRGLEPAWDVHGKYSTTFYTEEAVKIINTHGTKHNYPKKDKDTGGKAKPLFLYIAHTAVHSGNAYNPLPAPDETVDKFSYIKDYKRRRYAAILHELDVSVGKVVEALGENKMLDNSIIIFTTDNGGAAAGFDMNAASNWPLRGGKRTLWQGGTRGAALIWSPFFKKSGRVSEQFLHISDWLPTLISAVNGSTKGLHALDGFDSWRALSEDIPTDRTEALLNIDSKTNEAALISGDWKVTVGTFMNGTWDDWYGPSGLDSSYRYRLDLILKSDVSLAMDSIGHYLNRDKIHSLREKAQVKCEFKKSSLDEIDDKINLVVGPPIPCKPLVKPCLFNLKFDPCERRNLAEMFPDKLQALLNELDKHSASALPPTNLPMDPRARPALWDHTWTNFGDRTLTKHDDETCTLS